VTTLIVKISLVAVLFAVAAAIAWNEIRYRRSFRQAERDFYIDRARRHD
jgi:hypothetical protein